MEHWNAYWSQTKTLSSFAESEHQLGYTGEIADFWHRQLHQLPPQASVLDVATGNGALAVLALQYNEQLKVTAIDSADIQPLKLFNESDPCYPFLRKIHFLSKMPIETVNLSASSFELVISQFGFEYAETEIALAQIHRVLKEKGQFIALIHHKDSFITQDCIQGVICLNHILTQSELLPYAKSYIKLCERLAKHNCLSAEQLAQLKRQSNSLMQVIVKLRQQLTAEQQDWFNLSLKGLVDILTDWRKTSLVRLENWRQGLANSLLRLQEQIAAAWTEEYTKRILNKAVLNWALTEIKPFYVGQELLCWSLYFKKC